MACPHNFGFAPRISFEILHNERGQEVHENYINGFSETNSHLGKWAIGPKNIASS